MNTVAVTGLGICLPGHYKVASLYDALYRGESLLKNTVLGDGASNTTQVCSPVELDQISTIKHYYSLLQHAHISKATTMAVYAADEAIKHANITSFNNQRVGIFVGCNKVGIPASSIHTLWSASQSQHPASSFQAEIEQMRPNQSAEVIAQYFTLKAPLFTFGDACTAGATAIISAMRRIQHGELDVAICGATEYATHPFMQTSFAKLGALSLNTSFDASCVSRPFDKDRSGCLLADASAFLILESTEHARARGKTPLAILSAGIRQSEAVKFTATDPSGLYYSECMQQSLLQAGLTPQDIDHINAHGTSTVSNDHAESNAIADLFPHLPTVTATKSSLGHSLAASGAVEAVLSIESLQRQCVLPTLNFHQPGTNEPLLNIVKHGQHQALTHIQSNSFGFGGENASLIFSKAA